jgi:hypothetical protein
VSDRHLPAVLKATLKAIFTVLLVSVICFVVEARPKRDAKERSRLEDLFIWKTSEELKLPANQEQEFSDILHKLGERRRTASEKMDVAMKVMAAAKSKAESEKALTQYRLALKEFHAIQFSEIDELKKLLGVEKLSRYLVVKSELTDRLKTMLSQPQPASMPSAASGPLGNPKIIEEN